MPPTPTEAAVGTGFDPETTRWESAPTVTATRSGTGAPRPEVRAP